MMKRAEIIEHEEKRIVDQLDMLKFITEIKIPTIAEDIKSDFVLAKVEGGLTEKDKEAIIELVNDAHFVKKIILYIAKKASRQWGWDTETNEWVRTPRNEDEIAKMEGLAESSYDAFMIRVYMTIIFARNVKDNHLVNILAGVNTDKELAEEKQENSIMDKIKRKLKGSEGGLGA